MRANVLLAVALASVPLLAQNSNLGIFAKAADVGSPTIAGSTSYDAATKEFRIIGAGANMWAKQDQFQFVWREMTGDFTATATFHFLGEGNDHRKGGIMLRQSLDTDSAYADVVVHGIGMPSLQWRARKGEDTNTFDLPTQAPGAFTVRMVRNGVKVFFDVGRAGAEPQRIVNTEVSLTGPVLVGLVVCSHDPAKSETAIFSNVSINHP